jgi:peptide chain release factor 1
MLPTQKLDALAARFSEIEELLCIPEVISDSKRYTQLRREHGDLDELTKAWAEHKKASKALAEDRAALADPELRSMVEEEIPVLEARLLELEQELELLLLPRDPNDARNTILEIRSGTGGEEAALFAADLFRMYTRFAERAGWKVEILSSSDASAGGLKEMIASVTGQQVYSRLRFESGVHRVQRVPATETQGRIHTSTATVAVLPEADEVEVEIDDKDLEISIAASGGPGGQGVNTTNSAVQILHRPSGLIVKCQDERSQLKNKARALKVLRARLLERAQNVEHERIAEERRGMVGGGERSEKIRTYNYPQNRITDHRIGLTLHKLDQVIAGDLDEMLGALRSHRQAELLASASEFAS